ncbi:hypothetical protein SAMN05878482_10344 [Peribacillus simplex]|uniref:Uncharacterized protein n=1 Tax=Peribacillus simplex TaxID=1478 RepID=A0A9X8R8S8_9BACI|nr:hypothetical protein [Peribacillus simplex]SIR22009.1 hypothetical protein SAMN05878482_10344 [Peribacillus simplex]
MLEWIIIGGGLALYGSHFNALLTFSIRTPSGCVSIQPAEISGNGSLEQ